MKLLAQIGYKKGFYIALALLLFIAVLAFSRTISPTIELMKDVSQMEERLDKDGDVAQRVKSLSVEYAQLKSAIGNTSLDPSDIRAIAVEEVTLYSNGRNVEMVDLAEIHTIIESDYELSTHRIKVQGGFHDLLELQDHFEREVEDVKLSGVRYFIEKEKRTRKNKLYVEFMFQNIRKG